MERNQQLELRIKGMAEDDWQPRNVEAAGLIENMERGPDGVWRTMPGALQVTDAPGTGAVIALTWFQPRPNQRWLVIEEIDTENTSLLRYISWPSGTPVTFATRSRVAGRPTSGQFLQVGRWLYHFNGLDRPIRWDGDIVLPMGFYARPPAPVISDDAQQASDSDLADACGAVLVGTIEYAKSWQRGLGLLPASAETSRWVVAYGVTWVISVNGVWQESPMSPLAFASGINDNASSNFGLRTVRLQIAAAPREVVGVRLWRSADLVDGVSLQPQLYHLTSFGVGGGFDYVDHAPDAELGEARVESQYGTVPPGVRCAAYHHNAMWVAVDHQVFASAALQHEVFPPGSRYDVGASGSGHIISMWSVPRGLVVVKTRGVWMLKGNPVEGYRAEVVSENAECAGPRAMAYVEGIGLMLLSTRGPMVLVGTLDDDQTTRLIPLAGIRKTWRRYVSPRSLHNAVVVHRPEVEEVWFHVPRMGETKPTLGLVYHYGAGNQGWSLRPDWKFTSACTYQGRTWLGSHDTSDLATRGVFLLTRGAVGAATGGTANEPPDPSTPISPTYTEPTPIPQSGNTWFQTNISGDEVVGVFESSVITSARRTAPQSVELVGIPTGAPGALDVQVRYDRRVHFDATNDENWLNDQHSEQSDKTDDSLFRPRWGVSAWDEDGMWTEHEPGVLLVPVPTEAQHEFQIRVRGLDLRIAGIRVWVDRQAPNTPREVP